MQSLTMAWNRAGALTAEVCDWRLGPLPRPAMMRSGCAVGGSFLTFYIGGDIEAAVIGAIFTNLLCLTDRAQTLRARLWVTAMSALTSACAAGVGTLISGNDPLILVTLFAFALFAGFTQGTLPGVEAIPRFAIICFVIAAYLPVANSGTFAAIFFGTMLAMAAIWLDYRIRNGARSPRVARMNANVIYPGPLFSIAYGAAAVCALGAGLIWAQVRPYWIAITTLVVMQPDRRASMVRVIQRFVGTLGGVVLAFATVRAVPDAALPDLLFCLIVVLPFLWPWGFDRNYGMGVAILSFWVLILIDAATPQSEVAVPLFFARLSDTAIGCAVALVGSLFVFETRNGPDM